MNQFSVTFQIDNRMVPFTTEALSNFLCNLSSRFLSKDIMEKVNTTYKLLKIGFTDRANQVSLELIDLGFTIKHEISTLTKVGEVNDNQLRKRRSGALEFLASLFTHFTEISILSSKLVCSNSC